MNRPLLIVVWLFAAAGMLFADSASKPVIQDIDGKIVVEAEDFFEQHQTGTHAWHLTSADAEPNVKPDIDAAHLAGASGGAYVEVLPDLRQNGQPIPPDKAGLSDTAGAHAVLNYRIRVDRPGRYYIWARSYGSDGDDNTVHFGLDGTWPASSGRFHGRAAKQWSWECRHRTTKEKIYLDIDKLGEHIISVSMREDGFELDQFILTDNAQFQPPGYVPASSTSSTSRVATLFCDASNPQVRFAADEIRRALADRGEALTQSSLDQAIPDRGMRLVIATDIESSRHIAKSLKIASLKTTTAQAYAVRRAKKGDDGLYVILAADPTGAMYGGFDLAEAIRLGALAELEDGEHSPHIARRGIKFNIPLDLRTPSYSDCSDSAQQNIPEVWSIDFWHDYFDEMARNRYNVITLWNLHPFPSMVKVPEFPDVALNDVLRTTLPLEDTFSGSGRDMVRPEMLEQVETVKKMTIEEKIKFWREVMQYAHDRGIEVYLFTWNIFTFGAEGKHGITRSQSNPVTIDYFRASVRETVLTYPLLDGIGLTAGEQMDPLNKEVPKEEWLWRTYGEGFRDAKKIQPDREIRLIHRIHQTNFGPLLEQWKEYPGPLDFSFKYAQSHMYASTAPPFIKEFLPHLPKDRRTWLTVRNDDVLSYRWGDPDYAREFIRALPGPDQLAGYYMGPDGYTWGREFISTEPETPRELVLQKQWYSFMLWGRLSYDPDLPNALFEKTLAERYPEAPGKDLYNASCEASKIIPQITRFFWGINDFRWFPEACLSHPRWKGFYTVRHFIEGETMPESGILCLTDYRARLMGDQPIDGITPIQVADALEGHATATLAHLNALPQSPKQKELRLFLGDLEAMAHLGNFYASKIRGASEMMLFEATGTPERKTSAIAHLENSLRHWKQYAAVATRQYKPQLMNRVGWVDLNKLTEKVEEDLEMVRNLR